jgi:hypothetical protein
MSLHQQSLDKISEFLQVSWNVVFYITNLQGWFLLQVQQAYNDAGQFTRWGKFRQAIKENVAVSSHAAGLLSQLIQTAGARVVGGAVGRDGRLQYIH